MEVVKRKQ